MTYQLTQEVAILLGGRKEEELSGWLKRVSESEIIENYSGNSLSTGSPGDLQSQ
jgi:hypothetical protein